MDKIIVSCKALRDNLSLIHKLAANKTVMPILEYLHFKTEKNILIVTATDLQTTAQVKIAIDDGEMIDEFLLPAKILMDTLKNLEEQPISISREDDNYISEIQSDNAVYHLPGLNPKEFVTVPKTAKKNHFSLEADLLARYLSKALLFTGPEDQHPQMAGIFIEFQKDKIVFASTDSHKILEASYTKTFKLKVGTENCVIISKNAAKRLIDIASQKTGDVKIIIDQEQCFFQFGDIEIITRIIDGTYPNYKAVFPENNVHTLVARPDKLLPALKRLSVYNKKIFEISLNKKESEFISNNIDLSMDAIETLTMKYEGDQMSIRFNTQFMIDAISSLQEFDTIRITFSQPNRAALIFPDIDEEQFPNESIKILVMPVILDQPINKEYS